MGRFIKQADLVGKRLDLGKVGIPDAAGTGVVGKAQLLVGRTVEYQQDVHGARLYLVLQGSKLAVRCQLQHKTRLTGSVLPGWIGPAGLVRRPVEGCLHVSEQLIAVHIRHRPGVIDHCDPGLTRGRGHYIFNCGGNAHAEDNQDQNDDRADDEAALPQAFLKLVGQDQPDIAQRMLLCRSAHARTHSVLHVLDGWGFRRFYNVMCHDYLPPDVARVGEASVGAALPTCSMKMSVRDGSASSKRLSMPPWASAASTIWLGLRLA